MTKIGRSEFLTVEENLSINAWLKNTAVFAKILGFFPSFQLPPHVVPIQAINLDTQFAFAYAYLIKKRFYHVMAINGE